MLTTASAHDHQQSCRLDVPEQTIAAYTHDISCSSPWHSKEADIDESCTPGDSKVGTFLRCLTRQHPPGSPSLPQAAMNVLC
jgi:hypothetical protein